MLYPSLSQSIDFVSVSCRGMFNKETIGKMKKGAYLINTARGGICDRDAVAEALESGQLLGETSSCQCQTLTLLHHPL